jgi:tryptophan synthase beta chain
VLINLSGRGDKDMGTAIEWFGLGDADLGPDADLEQVEADAATGLDTEAQQ